MTEDIDNYKEQPNLPCCYNCYDSSYDCDKDIYCTNKRRPHSRGGTTKFYVLPTDTCDKFNLELRNQGQESKVSIVQDEDGYIEKRPLRDD